MPITGTKGLALSQLVVLALGSGAFAAFGNSSLAASFAVGAALMLTNVVAIAWVSWRQLEQKSIAWTMMIIVSKYAVLLGSIFFLARTSWFSPIGAGLGIASFLIAALVFAIFTQKKETE
jgi:hypothetical protein